MGELRSQQRHLPQLQPQLSPLSLQLPSLPSSALKAEGFPTEDENNLVDCVLMNGDNGWQWTDADCTTAAAPAICQMGDYSNGPTPPPPTTTTQPGETTTSGGGENTTPGGDYKVGLVGGSSDNEGNVW